MAVVVLPVAVDNPSAFRWQALTWAMKQQAHQDGWFAFLDNNAIGYPNDPFPNRLFVGAKRVVSLAAPTVFQDLYEAHCRQPSFLVGYLGYDLKNELEVLRSRNPDRLGFSDAFFVEPEWIIEFTGTGAMVTGDGDAEFIVREIQRVDLPDDSSFLQTDRTGNVKCRVSPEEYRRTVHQIQQHILAGDVYELNYCIEFFLETFYSIR